MTLTADLRIDRLSAAAHWDVVVVGSGLGGLSAAAFLAANGRRVLVLEQHGSVGGSSLVGMTRAGECEPGGRMRTLLGALGADHLEWLAMDPDGFTTVTLPEVTVRVPVGWEAYEQRLVETFPAEAEAVRRCLTTLREVAAELRAPRSDGLLRRLGGAGVRRWERRTLGDLLDSCGLGLSARAVIAAEGEGHALAPSATPVSVHAGLLDHLLTSGAWTPRGGGEALAQALAQVVLGHGGEVRTGVRVDRIMVECGRAIGVTLVDGEEVHAETVVSGADPRRTWLGLVGREHLPKRLLRQAEAMEPAMPCFTARVVVDQELAETLDEALGRSTHWVLPSTDLEPHHADVAAGRLPAEVPVMMTARTAVDPDSADAGRAVLELVAVAPREHHVWGLRAGGPVAGERYSSNPDYLTAKQRMLDAVLDTAERVLPGLRDHVVDCEAATPVTHERRTSASGGSALGLALTPDQVGSRRPDVTSPVPGLFLAGAGTRHLPGVLNTLHGGAATAGAVLGRDLLAEVAAGRTYAVGGRAPRVATVADGRQDH